MNSSGFSEPLDSSHNHPTSQQTAEGRLLPRQAQKRIASLGPVLKHLGFDRSKSSSRNGNKLAESRQHGTSDKDKGTSTTENVNNLNLIGLTSAVAADCGADSPSTLVKKTTAKSSISEEGEHCSPDVIVNEDLSEGQGCSLKNVVDNIDEYSAHFSFRECRKDQAKRSKLEDAEAESPDVISWRNQCSKSNKEVSNSNIQLQHPQTMENNFSIECEMLDNKAEFIDSHIDHSLPASFGRKKAPHNTNLKHGPSSKQKQNHYHKSPPLSPFDICESECELHTSTEVIFAKDEQQSSEMFEPADRDCSRVLRPGMVLLKGYLTLDEQVSIVRECRNLGLGTGGFYQPGYKYGAKLRLMMMCLGRDWDPQTRRYSNCRRFDKSKPPNIPYQFFDMVSRAMVESQELTEKEKEYEHINVEEILPMMLPNICIVNFYNTTGRLGLHQDRDESRESLSKGLPVVSISIGDAAEFLYGENRDINNAERLVLESGDVLIFGGESRHIFHGVESIIPGSAPEPLFEKTFLRPGRLNLTFRQE